MLPKCIYLIINVGAWLKPCGIDPNILAEGHLVKNALTCTANNIFV